MEDVLIHEAIEERKEDEDRGKIEMTETRKSHIRLGTMVFIGIIVICILIILFPYSH